MKPNKLVFKKLPPKIATNLSRCGNIAFRKVRPLTAKELRKAYRPKPNFRPMMELVFQGLPKDVDGDNPLTLHDYLSLRAEVDKEWGKFAKDWRLLKKIAQTQKTPKEKITCGFYFGYKCARERYRC